MYMFTWTNLNILNMPVVKAQNEIKAYLGWSVVYAYVRDDPCGDVIYLHGLVFMFKEG